MARTRIKLQPVPESIKADLRLIEQKAHPNFGSKFATPASLRVDFHYIHLDLINRWTWERFKRLANFLKLTPYEVASIAGIPHAVVARWEYKSAIPIPAVAGAWSAVLVLTVLEHEVLSKWTNDTIANPFPDLTNTTDALPQNP